MDLKNKKVTVAGLGNSGLSAAMALDDLGAFVRVTEKADNPDIRNNIERLEHRDIGIEIGGHTKSFIEDSALLVLSPGVPDDSPPVVWAEALKIPIISEMELGYRLCRGRMIAITGTNGKSTVTTLVGNILKEAGFKTVVCGNIGNALSGEVGRITKDHWVALEVSSFQLERAAEFRPAISVILNITDDHQDRYPGFKRYFDEKTKIFRNQEKDDMLVLNYDALNLRGLKEAFRPKAEVLFYSRLEPVNGAFVKDGKIFCVAKGVQKEICGVNDIKLKGSHNLENVLAAVLAATLAGANADSVQDAIKKFAGLPHRFETVAVINGVKFVDDSKGTTVDSTIRALESGRENKVVLIAGGRDKNSDYTAIREMVKRKVKHLVLIGEAKDRIKKAVSDLAPASEAGTMEEAVDISFNLSRRGEMVLLSPMCSSFDMFRDYRHRGDAFKAAVMRLTQK